MQLIHKAIWIVCTVTAISVAASFAGQYFFVIPALKKIEAIADHKDIERVQLGIELIQRQVGVMAIDIAPWDDTMEYFSNRDPDYLKRNFTIPGLLNQRVNLIIFADNNGQALWSKQVDLNVEESVVPDPQLVELLVTRAGSNCWPILLVK